MARIFVHIGMTKTGSTSIQGAFHAARERLLPLGIDYLDMGQNHSRVMKVSLRGKSKRLKGEVVKQLGVAKGDGDYAVSTVDRLIEQKFAACRASAMVMSGEGFFSLTPEERRKFHAVLHRHFDDVRIVAYVRDPVGWASSRAQENIKHGHSIAELTASVAEDPAESPIVPHYRRHLGDWIEVFGRDAVDIRVFDRRRFVDGDLIADFCAAIGADPAVAPLLPRPWNNPRTSHEALLLIESHYRLVLARRVAAAPPGKAKGRKNRIKADDPETRALDYWFRTGIRQVPGTPFVLPRPVLEAIWAAVQDDIGWLRQTIGDAGLFADAWPPAEADGPRWSAETLDALTPMLDRAIGRRRRSEFMQWLGSGPQQMLPRLVAAARRRIGL